MSAVIDQAALERVGKAFSADSMFAVRKMTRAAIHEIAATVKPGMVEEDAVKLAKRILAGHSMLRGWHEVYVRFGSNTTKTFGAPSDPGIVLGTDDIFFIDIGPVWKDWEGDGGDTFVTGADADMARCARDARALFHSVRRKWKDSALSGKELYDFADSQARALGWELNLDLSGHRLADFPHAMAYDGPMASVPFRPSALLWVLEIHIRHPIRRFGAFFEDMLLDDDYFDPS